MRIMAPKNLENPSKFIINRFRLWDLDWRFFIILLPALSLLVVVSLFTSSTIPFLSHFYAPHIPTLPQSSKIAVCLVGGARKFELTGPSIIRNILDVYPNADLFLHAPLDTEAYKFSLLKNAPKITVVRVFKQKPIPETESHHRVLTSFGSPNGIQGLIQYFNLVEGCLSMITMYQQRNNFIYDWIIRVRADGYWSAPLDPELFIPGHYLVPSGSSFGGLNDRFGLGDLNTSKVALSRLSVIPVLDSLKLTQLTSEGSFKAQLTKFGVRHITKRIPFCLMTDRTYHYPPHRYGTPVSTISSRGPLSGSRCKPCRPICKGACVEKVMKGVDKNWGWTDWANGSLELCDAHGRFENAPAKFENGWEEVFDAAVGKKIAAERKRVSALNLQECVRDFEEMRKKTHVWNAPTPEKICGMKFKVLT